MRRLPQRILDHVAAGGREPVSSWSGSSVSDGGRAARQNGVVRAYDARTGALKWGWDPVAREASQPGYDTWRGPARIRPARPTRGRSSAPTPGAISYSCGRQRQPGLLRRRAARPESVRELIVALRASTGQMVWHFQAVHHDLWDYEFPPSRCSSRCIAAAARFRRWRSRPRWGSSSSSIARPANRCFRSKSARCPRATCPARRRGQRSRPDEARTARAASADTRRRLGVNAESRAWCRDRIAALRSEGMLHAAVGARLDCLPGQCRRLELERRLDRSGAASGLSAAQSPRDAGRADRGGVIAPHSSARAANYEVAPQSGTAFRCEGGHR